MKIKKRIKNNYYKTNAKDSRHNAKVSIYNQFLSAHTISKMYDIALKRKIPKTEEAINHVKDIWKEYTKNQIEESKKESNIPFNSKYLEGVLNDLEKIKHMYELFGEKFEYINFLSEVVSNSIESAGNKDSIDLLALVDIVKDENITYSEKAKNKLITYITEDWEKKNVAEKYTISYMLANIGNLEPIAKELPSNIIAYFQKKLNNLLKQSRSSHT